MVSTSGWWWTVVAYAVVAASWPAAIVQARPLEYHAERTLPDGRQVAVTFLGDVARGAIRGDLTVGTEAYDVDGVVETDGDVFLAVSTPGGAAVATFDGRLGDGGRIDGVVAPTADPGKRIPLVLPTVSLRLQDAR